MKKEIEKLRKKFITAKTDGEIDTIDREMEALVREDQTAFEDAMLSSIRATNRKVEDEILRSQLKDILPAISVSYFAREYFHRTPQWFYQRLNGNTVNGKRAKFTNDELNTLTKALTDTADRIYKSVSLVVGT